MRTLSCEIEGVNIVLLGDFNPKIFQPSWFSHHELIRKQEAEAAENVVAVNQVTTFNSAWLSLQVTAQKFQVSTADAGSFEALRDLVLGTFRILEHTPFEKMGINRDMHYRVLPPEEYVEFGHFLVPKAPWTSILRNPVTKSLTVEGFVSRADENVKLTVKVEPSVTIQPGVYIGTNEHYEMTGEDGGKRLMTALETHWDSAQATAKEIAEHLLNQEY